MAPPLYSYASGPPLNTRMLRSSQEIKPAHFFRPFNPSLANTRDVSVRKVMQGDNESRSPLFFLTFPLSPDPQQSPAKAKAIFPVPKFPLFQDSKTDPHPHPEQKTNEKNKKNIAAGDRAWCIFPCIAPLPPPPLEPSLSANQPLFSLIPGGGKGTKIQAINKERENNK